jgi:hypothetical protein
MRVCYQPTLATPGDWLKVDSRDWHKTAARPAPVGGETIDDGLGWVHRGCVQGVEFVADHHAVEHVSANELRYYIWNDDPADYPPGERFAEVWTFKTLAPDPRLNGAINTRQSRVVYADVGGRLWRAMIADGAVENTTFEDWSLFRVPDPALIRHGIWAPDALNAAHEAGYTPQGWRTWSEGVPSDQLDRRGHVRPQRPDGKYSVPDGTLTYYQTANALANGIHAAVDPADELALGTSADSSSGQSGNFGGGDSGFAFIFTTPSNQPNNDAWPSGDYRCQLDVSSVGGNLTYGFLTQGSAGGHFARVNSGLTSDLESWAQSEGAFSGNGLKLATTGSITPISGDLSDRWELALAAQRPASHGNQILSLTFDGDAFADGPWPSADVANAVFFGAEF